MTNDLWPCDQCGNPGVCNMGKYGYCSTHLAVLYALFDPVVFKQGGVGLPHEGGSQHPEYGPCIEDLRCCRCGATWAGIAGDHCQWCQNEFERVEAQQGRLLLTVPDVDPDDETYEARMGAWADRMAVGVAAGIIDAQDAERAWQRTTKAAA